VSSLEIPWEDFHGDDNCVALTGENRVRVYLAQIRRALDSLRRSIEQDTAITNAERHAVAHFVGRLHRTFEVLALRHYYPQPGRELKIDRKDSGFVHWSALLELAVDLEQKEHELAGLAKPEAIKRQMLSQIVDHSLHPRDLQAELMRRIYLEALDAEVLFRSFLPGPLEPVGRPDDEEGPSYFWSFATYDRALNRPFVYLLYFALDASREKRLSEDSETFAALCQTAEACAAGRINLLGVSHQLDAQLPALRPRIVKRLVLGPYWSPEFTSVDGPFGELLASLSEQLPFALRWESETLISERETRVDAGWLSKGRLRQVFWVPKTLDLSARGVSQLERYVLLPHWLAQRVRAEGLLEDHQQLVIEGDEGVHELA
jgi:hypothetical protein